MLTRPLQAKKSPVKRCPLFRNMHIRSKNYIFRLYFKGSKGSMNTSSVTSFNQLTLYFWKLVLILDVEWPIKNRFKWMPLISSEWNTSTVDRYYWNKNFTHTVLPFLEDSWIITFEFRTIIINISDFYLEDDSGCVYYCAICWTTILVQ